MSDVNKVNFLREAAELFPPNGHVNQVLKAHFLTTSRQVAKTNVSLATSTEFGGTRICQKCSVCWIDGNYRMKVISTRIERPKQKKLLQKLEAGELLTKKQKIRAKWLKKKKTSFVEVKCLLCGNKSKLHLNRPPRKDSNEEQKPKINEVKEEPITKKKTSKKKRKDKFVGLNPALVQVASTSNQQSAPGTSQQKKPSNAEKKLNPTSLNIKKTKNKQNIKNSIPKDVSKTKQKNTLLQLANLLKANNSSNTKSSTNNRLENLLRHNDNSPTNK